MSLFKFTKIPVKGKKDEAPKPTPKANEPQKPSLKPAEAAKTAPKPLPAKKSGAVVPKGKEPLKGAQKGGAEEGKKKAVPVKRRIDPVEERERMRRREMERRGRLVRNPLDEFDMDDGFLVEDGEDEEDMLVNDILGPVEPKKRKARTWKELEEEDPVRYMKLRLKKFNEEHISRYGTGSAGVTSGQKVREEDEVTARIGRMEEIEDMRRSARKHK